MIKAYHDAECTEEITEQNPDLIKSAALAGADMQDTKVIYLKSDGPNLTYENISAYTVGDIDGADKQGEIDILYSLDGETYTQTVDIPNGDFETPVSLWRKAIAPAVTDAFNLYQIEHKILYDEYVR